MATKSNPLNSNTVSTAYSPSDGGSIKTTDGTKHVDSLTPKSKCAIVAFVVGGVAGVVIVILGAINLFGPVGSIGFLVSIAGGGAVAVIAAGGVMWIAISNCKRSQEAATDIIETKTATQAVDFARQQLSEHPEIKPEVFCAGWLGSAKTNQPVNQEIALLTALYWEVYFVAFEQEIKKYKDDPWSRPEVIQAADNLMKTAYAISRLTLEDLPEFTQALEKKGEKRSFAEALTKQDSYQYRTYYYCTNVYHWIRSGIVCRKREGEDEEGLFPPKETPKKHVADFYQEGTIQFGWRALYNDYCDRVRQYVKEKDLQKADNRHFTWTQKDKGENTFSAIPDTQPT
jgi:hypothetical protein